MRKQYINYDWYYKDSYSLSDLKPGNYDGFELVNIPHTNKVTPLSNFDQTISNFISVYKKTIEITNLDKEYYLVFEGIGHKADVMINGKLAKRHTCGYTAFEVKLNDYAIVGNNEIAVVVDSNEINQPPFGFVIDYLCFGGIYRNVYLNILNKTHINNYYFHHDDKKYYIDYEISTNEKVSIRTTIKGFGKKYTITTLAGEKIYDELPSVKLWSVEEPNLYDLTIELLDKNGDVIDEINDKIGFRFIEFKENGFFLNGKHLKIRGLNRHQSYPYVGYAMPDSEQYEDAKILKNELKLNAVRTSHYPQSQSFYNACDELGLLVFTEIPGWQHVGDLEWQDKAVENVKDMIIENRNHPSIILWGVRINESGDYHDFYTRTNETAHKLDPYRLTGGVRCSLHSELLEDVYTYNDFINTNKGIELREKEEVTTSNKPYLVSEYGGHMMPVKAFDSEIRRTDVALLHTGVLKKSLENDKIAGSFGWCAFDYNTHLDFGSGDLICYHGVYDIFRNPKYSSYPYKTFDSEAYLEVTSNFNIGEHNGGYIRYFEIVSNCELIEMWHNNILVQTFDNLTGPMGGCIKVTDLLGDLLIKLEDKTQEESDYYKEIVSLLLKYDGIKRKEITDIYPLKDVDLAWNYYGKYVAGWGAHPTPYTFKGYKGGLLATSITKGPQYLEYIKVTQDKEVLHTAKSYDCARITLEAIGSLGHRCDYAFDSFIVEGIDGVEVIGDKLISLIGGVRSFYVKTTKLKGDAKVRITFANGSTKEVLFTINND